MIMGIGFCGWSETRGVMVSVRSACDRCLSFSSMWTCCLQRAARQLRSVAPSFRYSSSVGRNAQIITKPILIYEAPLKQATFYRWAETVSDIDYACIYDYVACDSCFALFGLRQSSELWGLM